MTVRQVWEGMLTELSKVNAPSMLLLDFNYFLNKAVYQYVNKRYNIYDINLLTADDLRVLKSNAILSPSLANRTIDGVTKLNLDNVYEIYLPLDYFHILNCVCIYKVDKPYKCYSKGDYVLYTAKRLTADAWPIIMNDYYNRPLPLRPYFYIHNVNTFTNLPTNPIENTVILNTNTIGTDASQDYLVNPGNNSLTTGPSSNLPRTINLRNINNKSTVEKEIGMRYGNPSSIRCEIRYGDDSIFKILAVSIDYIKTPQTIRLTQELINLTEDTSQIMEFPDYVCLEIINELTMLVMENISDPRLLTNTVVTQSIANPARQLT